MGILLGLAAAFCWGIADFLVRYAASQIGPYRTLFYMQFFGLAVLTLYLVASGTLKALVSQNSWQPWAWLLLVAIINTCSSLALYHAFTIGILMIVSPITSANAAITVLLAFLSGEKVSQVRASGMGIVLLGVVLTATVLPALKKLRIRSRQAREADPDSSKRTKKFSLPAGTGTALLAALGYGISFWLLGFLITPHLGGVAPTWVARMVTPLLLFSCAPLLKQPMEIPRSRVIWGYLTAISILDTAAFVFLVSASCKARSHLSVYWHRSMVR